VAALDGVAQRARGHKVARTVITSVFIQVVDLERIAKHAAAVSAQTQLAHAHQILGSP
jgi:hypothetical protein